MSIQKACKDGFITTRTKSWMFSLLLLSAYHPCLTFSFQVGTTVPLSLPKEKRHLELHSPLCRPSNVHDKEYSCSWMRLYAVPKDEGEITAKNARLPTALQANTLVDNPKSEWNIMDIFTQFSTSVVPLDGHTSAPSPKQQQLVEGASSAVWNARLLLLLSAALYGSNYTCIKILNEHMPLEIGPALRFLVAAMASIPFLLRDDKNDKVGTSSDKVRVYQNENDTISFSSFLKSNGVFLAGLEVGLWNTIGYLSQTRGLESTPASTSAFICSLAVVIVPFLDFVAGKQILKREILGAMLAVIGVGFLEMDGLQADLAGASDSFLTPGVLWSLVQPLAFGMGYWRIEHYTRAYPSEGKRLASSQLFSIAALTVMSAIFMDNGTSTITPELSQLMEWLSVPEVLGAILWTGVVTTALTVFIETFALKTLSAAETTIIYSAEPLFGSAIAAMVLGESMGSGGAAGAAMILGGCLLSSIGFGDDD